MKPSPELDVLIADKVMGLEVCKRDHELKFYTDDNCFECAKDFAKNYSTNIKAAWEVVEKMRAALDSGRFMLYDDNNGEWQCDINNYIEIGDTAPRVICLAALKAVGVEIDD